jgi:transposase
MEITMAWTELSRGQHDRKGDKYASDMRDAEWALIAPSMPLPKTTGRPRTTCLRDVVDALLYIATTGCQWRMLPNDFPPVSTVRGYFYAWRDDGLLDEINQKLVEAARLAENHKAQPNVHGATYVTIGPYAHYQNVSRWVTPV